MKRILAAALIIATLTVPSTATETSSESIWQETECRQEKMVLGSVDFLFKCCVAENKE